MDRSAVYEFRGSRSDGDPQRRGQRHARLKQEQARLVLYVLNGIVCLHIKLETVASTARVAGRDASQPCLQGPQCWLFADARGLHAGYQGQQNWLEI
jgi:hypothetical protein